MEQGVTWYEVLGVMPGAEPRKIRREYEARSGLLRPADDRGRAVERAHGGHPGPGPAGPRVARCSATRSPADTGWLALNRRALGYVELGAGNLPVSGGLPLGRPRD